MNPSSEGPLLNAADVADILSVSTKWVYARSRTNEIPHVKIGRSYRYRRDAIEEWIASLEVGG